MNAYQWPNPKHSFAYMYKMPWGYVNHDNRIALCPPPTLLQPVVAVVKPSKCSTPKPPSSTWPTKFRCLRHQLEFQRQSMLFKHLLFCSMCRLLRMFRLLRECTSCRFSSSSSGSSASLIAAQGEGRNDFPASSLAGNKPGKVNI